MKDTAMLDDRIWEKSRHFVPGKTAKTLMKHSSDIFEISQMGQKYVIENSKIVRHREQFSCSILFFWTRRYNFSWHTKFPLL